jgi:hypothetical protein
MRASEFFSHETAALLWGAPLPLIHDSDVHVTTFRGDAAPRSSGVHGHRVNQTLATVTEHGGFRVASPASTWAMLGRLSLFDLVAVGDYFARVWREDGYFRVNGGMPPLATLDDLASAVGAGRRVGIRSLRQALPLIRTDAWSHTETCTRLTITRADLPEPVLNRDQYDAFGAHLGCIDLAYPEFKVAIEYQGQHHGAQYAEDIDHIELLRAHGWIVIQVTSSLLYNDPAELVRRVRSALTERGWRA